ncbi:histone-lysine N-methyltransferase SETDB1-like [Diadema antillarum]|uniref:histone-lysine N-methyltransferase SETDB1-like n=1 Tax=Diadema antillarum TaxID=105358 RepID=UPI003A8BB677
MAAFAEQFMAEVTADLDDDLKSLRDKIDKITTDVAPKSEQLLQDCRNYLQEMKSLEAGIQDLLRADEDQKKKEQEAAEQEARDQENLFKSEITPDNWKSIHTLYEEMGELELSSEDSGNEGDGDEDDDEEEEEEDEIIFLGKTTDPSSRKRTAVQARLTPPSAASQQQTGVPPKPGNSQKVTVPIIINQPRVLAPATQRAQEPKTVQATLINVVRHPSQPNTVTTVLSVPMAPGTAAATHPIAQQQGVRIITQTVRPQLQQPQVGQRNPHLVPLLRSGVPVNMGAASQQASQPRQPLLAPKPPPKKGAPSEVVEIIDDDDDIVMLGSTPATSMAKKSTAKPQVSSKSAGNERIVRITPPEIHPSAMEGEDLFADDDATLPELVTGTKLLAKGEENFWFPGTLIGPTIHHKGMKKYKVMFVQGRKRLLSSKFLACISPSKPGDLAVGIRVVASYVVEDGSKTKGMYAGIIAEVPMKTNRGRYLVFFDDGYAQYLSCDQIHIVYHSSACVWADVDQFSRDFIREYLDRYPERPMVNLKTGQIVTTEWNGKWWNARVLEVQGSLANMLFEAAESRTAETEWIYRGSTRLKPLHELQKSLALSVGSGPTTEQLRQNKPYVEITKVHSDHILPEQQIPQPRPAMLGQLNAGSSNYLYSNLLKQCAKKSTAERSRRDDLSDDSDGELKKRKKKKKNRHRERRKDRYEEDKTFEPRMDSALEWGTKVERVKYMPHVCNPTCTSRTLPSNIKEATKNVNPLHWPMTFGFVRENYKQRGHINRRYVVYRGPCGKSLCSYEDILQYLRETKTDVLSVDRFSFDQFVHISTNIRRSRLNYRFYYMQMEDLSNGVEPVPISCVNECDTSVPPPLKYMTERQAVRGSKINTDINFLVGCDCVDDCATNDCACRKLTIEATAANPEGTTRPDAGYKNRLLYEQLQTGIYECNDRCKCSKNCLNRVVQNGLSLRLQVFKTTNRGWGIRCLDDIPKGMFVCTYAGQIWDEEEANKKGKEHGDEYFAELDYIEVVEKLKEGYESDVDPIEEDFSDKNSDDDSQNDQTQSSSDGDFQTTQSGMSSDGSADYVGPIWSCSDSRSSSNQGESSAGGGTRLVLRRQSENTEQSQWSVSSASSDTKKAPEPPLSAGKKPLVTAAGGDTRGSAEKSEAVILKYGYNPSPSKDYLDPKKVAAIRQRKQAQQEARLKMAEKEMDPPKNAANPGQVKIEKTAADKKPVAEDIKEEPSASQDDAISKRTSELAISYKGTAVKEESKDGVKVETKDEPNSEETDDKKLVKPRVITGPRARKSTCSRRKRLRYHGSPGAASQPVDEEEEKKEAKVDLPANTRSLFGEKHCYVMDAKNMGNLGRYLNHSCRPNLFVQNVFVDSHDLRFPWVAFFAADYIRAGVELNWDYNYEVGCVPGREIKCFCGATNCRGRLL